RWARTSILRRSSARGGWRARTHPLQIGYGLLRTRVIDHRYGFLPSCGTTFSRPPNAQASTMPRPAHHAALAVANGKMYVIGGWELFYLVERATVYLTSPLLEKRIT